MGQSTLMGRSANDLLARIAPNDRGFDFNPFKTYLPLQACGYVSDLCGWRSSPTHDCNASIIFIVDSLCIVSTKHYCMILTWLATYLEDNDQPSAKST
ncbi:hypothetical protein PG993_010737 [Apiospora rasikravindrae]|uniref:Uncharacterized protein n=1 Tax=Apiospora rasikravindrae TaxID=990691 RepID=A0ABR1SCI8_9PEZI